MWADIGTHHAHIDDDSRAIAPPMPPQSTRTASLGDEPRPLLWKYCMYVCATECTADVSVIRFVTSVCESESKNVLVIESRGTTLMQCMRLARRRLQDRTMRWTVACVCTLLFLAHGAVDGTRRADTVTPTDAHVNKTHRDGIHKVFIVFSNHLDVYVPCHA